MRFKLCDVAAVAHPRAAQCEALWDRYECVLGGCLQGIVIAGECDTAQLKCTRRKK
jgi:hypothetical protein